MSDDGLGFVPDATPVAAGQVNPQTAATHSDDGLGFVADTPEQLNEQKHGTIPEMLKTAGEGFGEGAASFLAPLAETSLGVKPEDIQGREEANPVIKNVAKATGLAASFVATEGIAPLLTGAGEAALHLAGLADVAKTASYGARVGSAAVRSAAEMAVLQSGDEVSKSIINNEPISAQHAIANVGLATALGAGGGAFMTGAVSPLWKATVGDRVEGFLGNMVSKFGGVEGAASTATDLSQKAGIEIPEAIKAKIDGDPTAEQIFSRLSQTDTTHAGRSFQETISNFQNDLSNKLVESLGNSPDYIQKLPAINKYETGVELTDSLHNGLKKIIDPITEEYDSTMSKFKDAALSNNHIRQAADDIAQLSLTNKWHISESDAQQKLMERVLEKLPRQQTAEDLKQFITNLRNSHPYGSNTYAAARDISKVLGEAQGKAVSDGIIAKGGNEIAAAQELKNYEDLRARYKGLMDTLDDVNEHLHVGDYDGPKTFLKALKKLGITNAEAVLNRLSGTKKAAVLDTIGKISPDTLAQIRQYHVDQLLHDSGGENFNSGNFLKRFEALTPQLKNLLADQSKQDQIKALGQLAEKLKDNNHNWSNTARTADKLAHGQLTPLTMLAALTGHGADAVLAQMGKLGFSEAKDATSLGLIKFLGSDQPIQSEGLKSTINFIHNAMKGEAFTARAVKNLFKSGAMVIGSGVLPDAKDREKLDKMVMQTQLNPDKLIAQQTDGSLGHYMPEHQAYLAKSTIAASSYLQSIRPAPTKLGILGKEIPPTKAAMARYDRALDIAQQPAIVLQHIKDGTLQISDREDLKSMFLEYYADVSNKLMAEAVNAQHAGETIPYKVRLGMSMFMGTALDATMDPAAIIAAQPKAQQPQGQPTGAQSKGRPAKINPKSANAYKTASQEAESDRSNRG